MFPKFFIHTYIPFFLASSKANTSVANQPTVLRAHCMWAFLPIMTHIPRTCAVIHHVLARPATITIQRIRHTRWKLIIPIFFSVFEFSDFQNWYHFLHIGCIYLWSDYSTYWPAPNCLSDMTLSFGYYCELSWIAPPPSLHHEIVTTLLPGWIIDWYSI